jgi:hypothetical protein
LELPDEETPLGIGFALDDKIYFLPLQEKQSTREHSHALVSSRRCPLHVSPISMIADVLMSHRWSFLSEFMAMESTSKVAHDSQQILRVLYSLHPPLREGIFSCCCCSAVGSNSTLVDIALCVRTVNCTNFVDTRVGGWLLRPTSNRGDPFAYDALLQQYLDIFDNADNAHEPSVFCRDLSLLAPLAEKLQGTSPCCSPASGSERLTYHLFDSIQGLIKELGMMDVFGGQEMLLPPILAGMENAGISVDLVNLTKNKDEIQKRIAHLEERYVHSFGHHLRSLVSFDM